MVSAGAALQMDPDKVVNRVSDSHTQRQPLPLEPDIVTYKTDSMLKRVL